MKIKVLKPGQVAKELDPKNALGNKEVCAVGVPNE